MKLICLNVNLFQQNNPVIQEFLHKHQDADILALQEVTRKVDSSVSENFLTKNVIDSTTPHLTHQFFSPVMMARDFKMQSFHGEENFAVDFGGYMDFGEYLKTSFPLTSAKSVFLQNQYSLVTDWSNWPKEEYRAVQVCDLLLGTSKSLRVINYHGFWSKNKEDSPRSISASQTILKLAQEVSTPVIICGDFNLFPDTESIKLVSSKYTSLIDTYHIKTTRPLSNELNQSARNVVDYVFTSKDILVKDFQVIDSSVSDHLPLVLDFDL